nr:hypothetical protein [Oceanococcus sp. HetDA_MAG_MS8]
MFSVLYLWYAMAFGGDAIPYFLSAQDFSWEFNFGTAAVKILTGLIVNGLGVSILGAFLVFNIFGVVGLLAFDACLLSAIQNKSKNLRRLATVIVFLPSVSFWSSAIGKDALSFMAMGLALWAALALDRRWQLMAFAIFVMLLVRPHIAVMMILAWSFSVLTSRQTRFRLRVFLLGLTIVASAIIVPFALKYAGLGDASTIEALSDYIEQRQGYNMEGGGGIDIASMSLPMRMFAYMFRPVLFEASTIFALAAAVDNLILVSLFFAGAWAMFRGRKSNLGESRTFMWIYASLAWLVLAMTTANLGIALRQKWMFAPMLIFLILSVLGAQKRRKLRGGSSLTRYPVSGMDASLRFGG